MSNATTKTTDRVNPEYARKVAVAGQLADAAWLAGGLDGMQGELASLRRLDADPVVIAELERLYHGQVIRVADSGAKYW